MIPITLALQIIWIEEYMNTILQKTLLHTPLTKGLLFWYFMKHLKMFTKQLLSKKSKKLD